jgi:hypothetical protein
MLSTFKHALMIQCVLQELYDILVKAPEFPLFRTKNESGQVEWNGDMS